MVVNGILSTNVADIGQKVSTLLLNISVTGFRLMGSQSLGVGDPELWDWSPNSESVIKSKL